MGRNVSQIKKERRKHVRYQFIYPIVYSTDNHYEQSTCLSENISLGGMLLQLSRPLAMDTILKICLPFSEGPYYLRARVRWLNDENNKVLAGVEFIKDSAVIDSHFQKFISQFSRISR
jgi:c-di-GMP-binding flagellar brake protein YcgR